MSVAEQGASRPRWPHVHVITPGDHYSPRTGSAVPTVVHGLASADAAAGARASVVIARGTYPERYESADIIEYEPSAQRPPGQRYLDLFAGRLGLPRPGAVAEWRASVVDQAAWQPSVVIGHNAVQLIRCVDARRHRPVLYAHNDLFRTYSGRELKKALAFVYRVICVSEFLARRAAARLPDELATRIRVVPNGADCERFYPPPERTGNETLRVLFVGRTIPEKGPDVLLRAAALLGRDDVSLTLIGSYGFDPAAPLTEFEQSLRTISDGVRGSVRFVPTVVRDEVAAALRTADVLVTPSRWPEPSGLTVLEGMASGLPVVASDIGGIPESLGDTGLLVPPDDPSALAEAIRRLAEDPELRRRLGCSARARAEQRDWAWARARLEQALA